MEYDLMNVCMDCGYEWEENKPVSCKKCHSGDICKIREADYRDLTIENCLSLFRKNIISVCDGDNRIINFREE